MKKLISSILVIFLLFTNQVFSEQKIAFIDMDKVISTSKPGSSILKQLTDLNKKNLKFLKDEEKIFKEKKFIETEFNLNLEIDITSRLRNNSISNNFNNIGRIDFNEIPISKLKYKYSKIKNFNQYEPEIVFNKKNIISKIMKNYIGGLQKYTPLLMQIHAPNVNSYRRLFATWGAPRNVNWGIGNRSCSFRVPSTEEKSMRIENRISGSDTNPYLIIAANLAAGYLGITNKIKPTAETKKSLFDEKNSALPKNMEEAISLFETNDDLNQIFNSKFIKTVAALRRAEYQSYLKVISSWEREYLLLNV